MKKTTTFLLVLALAIALFSAKMAYAGSTPTGNVTIENTGPTMGTVTLYNQAGADAAITLTAGSTVTVFANVTITDVNGGGDISSASAALYHSTSTSTATADENINIKNGTCALSAADGDTKVATCSFTMNYMALPGTWTANITATDSGAATVSGASAGDRTVNSLVGVDVTEAAINFGSLQLGANSSTAKNATIVNLGNAQMDSIFSGTNYSCATGTIPVGNTRYNMTTGSYDGGGTDLTVDAVTQTGFDLGIRGVLTADGTNATKAEFFTIKIPTTGVAGACANVITVSAVAG